MSFGQNESFTINHLQSKWSAAQKAKTHNEAWSRFAWYRGRATTK